MSTYHITGGRKLFGRIKTNTAKNSAVAILAASLLVRGKTELIDLPLIEEVKRMVEVLQSLEVKIAWLGKHRIFITPPSKLKLDKIDYQAAIKTRSIIFLLSALLPKAKNFKVPNVGGCKLGSRTVMPHLYALAKLGVKIKVSRKYFEVSHQKLVTNQKIVMYESGDTPTENVILAAVLIPGRTIIKLASANYQVQDLCYFLQSRGAKIKGIGTTTLEIIGVKKLSAGKAYPIMPDPIESMAWLSIAATTNSHLVITHCPIEFLELELLKLEKMGLRFKIVKQYQSKNGHFDLVNIEVFPSSLMALKEKLYARPFPGLNIDNLPLFVPVATQAKGQTLIHDWVYENRAVYYTKLKRLGANIKLADPHRAFIKGPTRLKGQKIICPPALRPALIILIAMLAAKGKSILGNVYSIERGYERVDQRLNQLGAKIERHD